MNNNKENKPRNKKKPLQYGLIFFRVGRKNTPEIIPNNSNNKI